MYDFNNQNKTTKQQTLSFRQIGLLLSLLACLLYSDIAQAQLPVWNLSRQFGLDHPLNSNVFFPVNFEHLLSGLEFADVDGDGDFDCVTGRSWGGTSPDSCDLEYFENIGTPTFPIFTQRFGASNPFDTIDDVNRPRLADLDADGDLDLVVCNQTFNTSLSRYVWYYENTGTATNPIFEARTGSQNPFDTVAAVMNAHPQNFNTGYYPMYNLVDIDADGDLDNLVLYYLEHSDFYLNVGSASNPDYVLQPSTSNPLNNLTNPDLSVRQYSSQPFIDLDNDGDFDLLVDHSNNNLNLSVYENTGDSSSASFAGSSVVVLDSTYNGLIDQTNGNNHQYGHYSFVDIDGDGDLDVFEFDFLGDILNYYENMEIVDTMTQVNWFAEETEDFGVYPNPCMGILNFNKVETGQLFIYGRAGTLLKSVAIENAQSIELNDLDNGMYYIILDADRKRRQGTIILQK